jgi:hypothetical protein
LGHLKANHESLRCIFPNTKPSPNIASFFVLENKAKNVAESENLAKRERDEASGTYNVGG